MARNGTRPQRPGPKPLLAGAALRKAVMAIWCVCFCCMLWRAGPSDSSAISPSARFTACSPVGPGSASGVGYSIGCAAPGGVPAAMPQNRAPWSSIAAPAARRRVALSAAPTVARRSGASRSRLPLRNTASLLPSMSHRRTSTTPKPAFQFCVSSPMAASMAQPSAISATGANGWPRSVRHSASPSRPLLAAETDSSFPPASAGRNSPRFRGR
jgi:hypothetical protein